MYTKLKIRNFRCFRSLDVEKLGLVNLITGANNVGKSALLEVLFLHCGAYNPELGIRLNVLRMPELSNLPLVREQSLLWESLFNDFDTHQEIEIESEDSDRGQRKMILSTSASKEAISQIDPQAIGNSGRPATDTAPAIGSDSLSIEWAGLEGNNGRVNLVVDGKGLRFEPTPPMPPFSTEYLTARNRNSAIKEAEQFGKLEVQGKQDVLVEALRLIEPRIKRLAVVVLPFGPMIHADIGLSRMLPLPMLGEGMGRMASLMLAIAQNAGGVVLIDELENGIHFKVLPRLWEAVAEASRRFRTQLFVTTHSRECVVAAHRVFAESSYDFLLFRLELDEDVTRIVSYDLDSLSAAIDADWEVR